MMLLLFAVNFKMYIFMNMLSKNNEILCYHLREFDTRLLMQKKLR